MKKVNYHILLTSLVFVLLSGCKTLNTDLTIRQKALPADFAGYQDSSSVARINWRQYFSDPLLLRLIDTAIVNNNDLQIAIQRIENARSNIKLAGSDLYPRVAIGITGGVSKPGLYTSEGAGNASTDITPGKTVPRNLPDMYLGIQSEWELDIWGKIRNQKRSAVAQYLASVEGKNFVVSNLVAGMASAYFRLVALDNTLEILLQTEKKQQEELEIVTLQRENGRVNELAVQQFRAQLLNSQGLEKDTRQQIVETENLITYLMGDYPEKVQRDKEILFKDIPLQLRTGIPSQLLDNRPDIREAGMQVEASRFNLKSAKAAFFPDLTLDAGIGYQAFSPSYLFLSPASLAYSVAGGLLSPLVNMGAIKARFNDAKANQLEALYNYQKTVLNGYCEVANGFSDIRLLQQKEALKKQEKEILEKSVETSLELFRSAKSSYLDVLIAQQNSLQSQIDFINIHRDLYLSGIKMYIALGGGWKK